MAEQATTSVIREHTQHKRIIRVKIGGIGQRYQISVQILRKAEDGKNVTQTVTVYLNAAMVKGLSGILAWLERVCRYKDLFGCYIIDEAYLDEFERRLQQANAEIQAESSDFLAHYDEHKEAVKTTIFNACVANKRKRDSAKIIKLAMNRFPTKGQIGSSSIYYTIDAEDDESYALLSGHTKELIDASRVIQEEHNRCYNIAKRCGPVFESITKFASQIYTTGKLHGSTVNSYRQAVKELEIAQKTEFAAPLPAIEAFLSIADKVVDNPADTVDACIMGFARFYAAQGIIDEAPFDTLADLNYNRELIEDLGTDVNNEFENLVKTMDLTLSVASAQ